MTTQHITSHYEQLSISICRNPQKCHHLGSRYQMMIEKSQFRIRFPCLPNNEVLFSDPISYHEYNIIHRLKKYQCNIDILKQLCGKMLNTYDDIKMIKNVFIDSATQHTEWDLIGCKKSVLTLHATSLTECYADCVYLYLVVDLSSVS